MDPDLPEFEEERDAFQRKLEDFLSEHMPADWMIAACIVIPEPRADTTMGHIWGYSNIPNEEVRTMIVGHWYLDLRGALGDRT